MPYFKIRFNSGAYEKTITFLLGLLTSGLDLANGFSVPPYVTIIILSLSFAPNLPSVELKPVWSLLSLQAAVEARMS